MADDASVVTDTALDDWDGIPCTAQDRLGDGGSIG